MSEYTNFTDKNGIEIGEDDILEFGSEPQPVGRAVVRWRDGMWILEFTDTYQDEALSSHIRSNRVNGRVIGNANDNPELLED